LLVLLLNAPEFPFEDSLPRFPFLFRTAEVLHYYPLIPHGNVLLPSFLLDYVKSLALALHTPQTLKNLQSSVHVKLDESLIRSLLPCHLLAYKDTEWISCSL